MTNRDTDNISGEIVDETMEITIVELCRSCAVDEDFVESMVDEGIIEPTRKRDKQWYFALSTVRQTRVVAHLQRDLGVNLAGAALAIELLDRLEHLERHSGDVGNQG